jgi:hypothetical protein
MVSPRAIWREGFLGSGIFCVQEAATRTSASSSGAADGRRERVFMAHLHRERVFMVRLAAHGSKKEAGEAPDRSARTGVFVKLTSC